jgi:hypothetical protein
LTKSLTTMRFNNVSETEFEQRFMQEFGRVKKPIEMTTVEVQAKLGMEDYPLCHVGLRLRNLSRRGAPLRRGRRSAWLIGVADELPVEFEAAMERLAGKVVVIEKVRVKVLQFIRTEETQWLQIMQPRNGRPPKI